MTIQVEYRRLMKPFFIRIIVESVIVVIIALIFLAIHISRLTLTRWEPRIPEAPPCTIYYPKEDKDQCSADADGHPVVLIHGFASSPSTYILSLIHI